MQLTPHFTLEEFTRSFTAVRLGIDNTPTVSTVANLKYLCQQVLEPLRSYINQSSPYKGDMEQSQGGSSAIRESGDGDQGVVISSGYRCPQLNQAVGGVPNSNHLHGYAADIQLPDLEQGREWFRWIMDHCDFDELIWEHTPKGTHWIHVATKRNGNRHRVIN